MPVYNKELNNSFSTKEAYDNSFAEFVTFAKV